VGGDEGEGEKISLFTPTLALPHQRGRVHLEEIFALQKKLHVEYIAKHNLTSNTTFGCIVFS
jgi:hypothetical protein